MDLVSSVMLSESRLVMAHGAGSGSEFLSVAFAADQVGVAQTGFVDDRTGKVGAVMTRLARAATDPAPTILGGVSLGGHAAARLLARADLPGHVVAGLIVMPAWSGQPGRVAGMTGAAADALAALGPAGVLGELDPHDWVTPLLARAWALRTPQDLVAELRAAADSAGPTEEELAAIRVPVGIVALADDPLHPAAVARAWQRTIPRAVLVELGREAPAGDLGAFGRAAKAALTEVLAD